MRYFLWTHHYQINDLFKFNCVTLQYVSLISLSGGRSWTPPCHPLLLWHVLFLQGITLLKKCASYLAAGRRGFLALMKFLKWRKFTFPTQLSTCPPGRYTSSYIPCFWNKADGVGSKEHWNLFPHPTFWEWKHPSWLWSHWARAWQPAVTGVQQT